MTSASIGRLWHYPVKSMRGEEVQEMRLAAGGVVGDRAYGFLDIATGGWRAPSGLGASVALLDCQAQISDAAHRRRAVATDRGHVSRRDRRPPDDEDELTRRVTHLLGREVRLVRTAPDGLASRN